MLILVFITILVALIFDFVNGMNDAANSIATIVSTRVLSPRVAVIWAAFWNFAALFIFGTSVASTVGSGIINTNMIEGQSGIYVIMSAMLGAIIWAYFFCARFGIPVSSSHSLIGGLMGAGLAKGGVGALVLKGAGGFFTSKIFIVVLFIFLAPIIGLIIGYFIMILFMWIARKSNPSKVDKISRVGQLVSSAAFSVGHGGNDAQKTMGVVALLLYSVKDNEFIHKYLYPYTEMVKGKLPIPYWVEITALTVISLGTLSGGMKIIKTMGMKLTHLKPIGGVSAEIGGAATLFTATAMGIPVSTTQTIAGSIMGVGTTRRFSAVRWGLARGIILTWILTIPMSALMGALTYLLISFFI